MTIFRMPLFSYVLIVFSTVSMLNMAMQRHAHCPDVIEMRSSPSLLSISAKSAAQRLASIDQLDEFLGNPNIISQISEPAQQAIAGRLRFAIDREIKERSKWINEPATRKWFFGDQGVEYNLGQLLFLLAVYKKASSFAPVDIKSNRSLTYIYESLQPGTKDLLRPYVTRSRRNYSLYERMSCDLDFVGNAGNDLTTLAPTCCCGCILCGVGLAMASLSSKILAFLCVPVCCCGLPCLCYCVGRECRGDNRFGRRGRSCRYHSSRSFLGQPTDAFESDDESE